MKTRRRFTAEFKAKVALEAIRGERTISELATNHQLHPNQITQWKRQAIENLAKAFDDRASDAQVGREAEVTKLHAKIVAHRGAGFFGQGLRSLSLNRRRMMLIPITTGSRSAANANWSRSRGCRSIDSRPTRRSRTWN